ncbi:MAG: DUF2807 domain-containing protein [Bacteroidia bacterium]|nr:DUF2807 domain-containing protein [Bacteroidia bacterium]NND52641.1 DUF2807 domain-containing protein [Flavobacteriaceae bacterium]
MKNIVTALTLLTSIMVFGQDPITKTIGEFSELKAYDLINVKLIKSDENKIEISGKNAKDVVVVNKNGKLKIRMNLEEIFDGNDTQIHLYFTSVDILDANEGAYIYSDDTFKQYELVMKAQEGGKIEIKSKLEVAEIKAISGGIIELKGKTNNQNINVSSGGIFRGEKFDSVTSKVSVRAGGEVYVNASELVDIKIRAGGDVYVYGDPNTVNESRALGGRIKRMQ